MNPELNEKITRNLISNQMRTPKEKATKLFAAAPETGKGVKLYSSEYFYYCGIGKINKRGLLLFIINY